MADPTLLQQARQQVKMAQAVCGAEQSARVLHIGIAVDRILQHLEGQQTAESWRQTRYAQKNREFAARVASIDAGLGDPGDAPPTVTIHSYTIAPGECLQLPHGLVTNHGPAKVFLNLHTGVAREEAAPVAEDDLTVLEKLCAEATSGPWVLDHHKRFIVGPDGGMVFELEHAASRGALSAAPSAESLASARFAIAARDALPKLIAEVRRLRGHIASLSQSIHDYDEEGSDA